MTKRNPQHDFDGKVSYKVTKPFTPHILDKELAEEHGFDKCDISVYGDSELASEENPVIVWFPESINDKQFRRVLDQHEVGE